MIRDEGSVHSVDVRPVGGRLAADYAIGSDTLQLYDAGDFNEDGGTLTITSYDAVSQLDWVTIQYTYSSADLDNDLVFIADVGGITVAAVEGDLVAVYPAALDRVAHVVMDELDEAVSARIPNYLAAQLTPGIREEGARETVTMELMNDEWVVTDIPGNSTRLTSSDFDEGTAGWQISDDTLQFDDMNVLNSAGVATLNADTILLGGQDLSNDVIGPMGQGVITRLLSPSGTNSAAVTTETIIFQVNAGTFYANRLYLIIIKGCLTASGVVAGQCPKAFVRATFDGTTPTLSTAIMSGGEIRLPVADSTQGPQFNHTITNFQASDSPVRFAVTLDKGDATSATWKLDQAQTRTEITIIDCGDITTVAGSIAQKSGVSQSDGTVTATHTWTCTSSKSYDGDSGSRSGDANTTDCYQGYYSSVHGNTKSILCFDDADMRSRLAGAVINSVKISFRVHHSQLTQGLWPLMKEHNNSSPPSTYSAGSAIAYTSTTNTSPSSGQSVTWTMPTSLGADLRDGVARGISFYSPDKYTMHFGYIYGPGSGSAPQITITYTK